MRLTAWALVMAFGAAACGGEQAAEGGEAGQGAEIAEQIAAPTSTGTAHEVGMTGDGTRFWFDPDTLTIKAGDTVRWTNRDGQPHNVKFYPDSIPEGAQAVLEAAMGDQVIGPLNGPLVTMLDATYEISFEGTPVGEYGIVCFPHEALGMTMKLTVEQ